MSRIFTGVFGTKWHVHWMNEEDRTSLTRIRPQLSTVALFSLACAHVKVYNVLICVRYITLIEFRKILDRDWTLEKRTSGKQP